MEGVNVLIQMAKLDRDGNGRISKEEMDKFLESSKLDTEYSGHPAPSCVERGHLSSSQDGV